MDTDHIESGDCMPCPEGVPGGASVPKKQRKRHRLSYQVLIGRALKEKWDVPEYLKVLAIEKSKEALQDPDVSPRTVAAITRNLISASQTNLAAIGTAVRAMEAGAIEDRLKAIEEQVLPSSEGTGPGNRHPGGEREIYDDDERYRLSGDKIIDLEAPGSS